MHSYNINKEGHGWIIWELGIVYFSFLLTREMEFDFLELGLENEEVNWDF